MQERVGSYTRRTRTQKERINEQSLGRRVARTFDSGIRRLLYALIKRILKVEPLESKVPLSQVTSVLIIPYGDAIGDLLVALPVSRAIKRRNPNCQVGMFVSERNRSLLRCEDSVDEQYLFGGRQDWRNVSELVRARKAGYQFVVNLHFTKLSDYGLIANFVGPKAIKASLRMKRSHHYQLLFNRLSPFYRYRVHISQLSLAILDDVIDFSPSPLRLEEAALGLSICPQTFERTRERVQAALDGVGASWFVYVNPQARNPEREWGFENIEQFADRLLADHTDAAVIVTSSPTMRDETKKLVESSARKGLLFVETGDDLNELASVCRLARLVITPDTAAVHFASAENKPVIVLMPDTREIHLEWLPLYCPSILFTPASSDLNVSSIRVDAVYAAAQHLLDGTISSTATVYGDQCALDHPYQRIAGAESVSNILPTLRIE